MLRKIILDNYMSHQRTEIEPAAGLTVLIGPNNCGKSAVVSALETLARATRGDFMVRHGEKESRVTVKTDDGHTIVWRRKSGTVSYVIDGREVHRDVPDDLHEHLKLPLVESDRGGAPFDVHFAFQKSPIFLLNESDSRAATFFSASSDAGRLLEIQDRHRDKVRERKRDRSRLAGEIAGIEAELARLDALPTLKSKLDQLEVEHAALLQSDGQIAALKQLVSGIEAQQWRIAAMTEQIKAFETLQPPPAIDPTEPIEQIISRLHQEATAADRASAAGRAISGLRLPPELTDTAPATRLINEIAETLLTQGRYTADLSTLTPLRDPPTLQDVQTLASEIKSLRRASARMSVPARLVETLANLREAPALADPQPLTQATSNLQTGAQSLAAAQRDLDDAAAQLRAVEDEIRAWAMKNPNCPVCGAVVSVQALLEEKGHVRD